MQATVQHQLVLQIYLGFYWKGKGWIFPKVKNTHPGNKIQPKDVILESLII